MKERYYALTDSFGRPVLFVRASSIEQARRKIKKFSKNQVKEAMKNLKVEGIRIAI